MRLAIGSAGRERKMLQLLLILATFFLLTCGDSAKIAPGTLVIAFDGSPTNLDPRIGTDSYSGRIWDMASSGLIKSTPSGEFVADIATTWETPDDRTIIFHLNPAAKFQDGRPITARDFKYTFDTVVDPRFASPKKSGYKSVASFEAPDDHTFIVRMKEPNAGIFDNLTYMLVPAGADPKVFANKPVLSGAYRVNAFAKDERISMTAFPDWVGGKPKINRIDVRIIPDATTRMLELRRGTVNFAINSIPLDEVDLFRRFPEFRIITARGSAYQYIAFNLKDPILARKEVRQAIAHAIDRKRIVRDLLHGYGTVTDSIFPVGHWARAEQLPDFEYNPALANQMLDAAGYRTAPGKMRFKLDFRTSTDAEANQQAQVIQQMLREVGIDMQIRSSEFGTFMEDIKKGRFQMFSLRRAGVSDPDFYYTIFHSSSLAPNGQNRGYYVNPRVDQLIEQGRATFDRATRKKDYDEIQRIVADELPYISLYHRDNVAIMRKNIEGFQMYPSGFLLSVPNMTVR